MCARVYGIETASGREPVNSPPYYNISSTSLWAKTIISQTIIRQILRHGGGGAGENTHTREITYKRNGPSAPAGTARSFLTSSSPPPLSSFRENVQRAWYRWRGNSSVLCKYTRTIIIIIIMPYKTCAHPRTSPQDTALHHARPFSR